LVAELLVVFVGDDGERNDDPPRFRLPGFFTFFFMLSIIPIFETCRPR